MNVGSPNSAPAPAAPRTSEAVSRLAALRALQKALEVEREPLPEPVAESQEKGQLLDIRC